MEKRIWSLKAFGRPIICTEYMARAFGSTIQEILPLLKKHNVGSFNWGFVQGKSQTNCPWNSWQVTYEQEPELWFHDILRKNGEPYDEKEVAFLKVINRKEMLEVQEAA
jgi:hypothetical protein